MSRAWDLLHFLLPTHPPFSGTEHFWVSIVVKSLRMGALADTFKRFPFLAAIIQRMFPQLLGEIIADARRHEAYTMDLVERQVSVHRAGMASLLTA